MIDPKQVSDFASMLKKIVNSPEAQEKGLSLVDFCNVFSENAIIRDTKSSKRAKKILQLTLHPDKRGGDTALFQKYNSCVGDATRQNEREFLDAVRQEMISVLPPVAPATLFSMPSTVGLSSASFFPTLTNDMRGAASDAFFTNLSYYLQEDMQLPTMIEELISKVITVYGAEAGGFAFSLLEERLTDLISRKAVNFTIDKFTTGIFSVITDAVSTYECYKSLLTNLKNAQDIAAILQGDPTVVLGKLKEKLGADKAIKLLGGEEKATGGIKLLQKYNVSLVQTVTDKAKTMAQNAREKVVSGAAAVIKPVITPLVRFVLQNTGKQGTALMLDVAQNQLVKDKISGKVQDLLTNALGAKSVDFLCLPAMSDEGKDAVKGAVGLVRAGVGRVVDPSRMKELEAERKKINENVKRQYNACLAQLELNNAEFASVRMKNFAVAAAQGALVGVSSLLGYDTGIKKLQKLWGEIPIDSGNVEAILNVLKSCIKDGSIYKKNEKNERNGIDSTIFGAQQNQIYETSEMRSIVSQLGTSLTPLMLASIFGRDDLVDAFLKAGEDPDRNHLGMSALHFALLFGHTEIAKTLIQASDRSSLNMAAANEGSTPLAIACYKGNVEIFEFLLKRMSELDVELDVNLPLKSKLTLLYAACKGISKTNGNDEKLNNVLTIINELLTRGASLSLGNDAGELPLQVFQESLKLAKHSILATKTYIR